MLSLFTPTHKPTYLVEAYNSLKLQTVEDWEWVILPNGPEANIPEVISRDPRVKIVVGGTDLHNIGALKRRACDAASGDVFIEFDHDDLLMPGDTLATIQKKFDEGAGFVYSDAAVFRYRPGDAPSFSKYCYSKAHGWQEYDVSVYGRPLLATESFDVTPRSLCEIYYAPDHVRCWSRKAYYEAGGHNPELSVCDDLELMIKTYLTGAPFVYTGGCHYLYRMFDHNTVIMRNPQIQSTTKLLKQEHFPALVQSWVDRENHNVMDISELRRSGWNADKHLLQGFGKAQYGHIMADDELQRLDGYQVREFMNAAYDSLIPGGYLTIIVPEVHSGLGYGDVEWKSQFSAMSMSPYIRKNMATRNGNIRCRFQQVQLTEVYPSDWHRDNGFKYLRFELSALKGQRQPGLQHI
jgi:glycosyltransferase involved in cell wall biosynthesis|tara:strand:- start:5541 stop:6764 length:1224 start_codon:yes stop_codon:yes gene_type:complete